MNCIPKGLSHRTPTREVQAFYLGRPDTFTIVSSYPANLSSFGRSRLRSLQERWLGMIAA